MRFYYVARLAEAVFAVWSAVTIVFFASRLLGDPSALLLPVSATEKEILEFRHALGLDQSIVVQYLKFLGDVLRGNFGESFQLMRPALDVVLERIPATLLLTFVALPFGILFGILAGSAAALWRGTFIETIVMFIALVGQATPNFCLAIMLILIFSVDLGWLPAGGYGSAGHIVLPALTLVTFSCASIARLFRSSLLEVMSEDYVRTAHAKGLQRTTVFFWHVARNALVPVVTMAGILAGELLGGAVVTETVFAWPGVGRLIVQAIESRDFPVVQAGVTIIAIMFVSINFLVDILYGVLDPRIQVRR